MLPNPNLGPDPYSQRLTLLMQQRLATRRRQSLRLDHCRAKRQQACCAQRPRAVEDAGTVESAAASGVEAVPLGEEKVKRTRLSLSQPLSDCPDRLELSAWSTHLGAPRSEVNGLVSPLEAHVSGEVRQVESKACAQDGERVVGVQGQKPQPWDAIEVDVSPDVQLVGSAQCGKRRREDRPDTPHGERRHAHPCGSLEGIDGQEVRD